MAYRDYVPSTDAGLLSFGSNMSTKITASPTTYGLAIGDATLLSGKVSAYEAALTEATNPDTRTKPKVAAKDLCRAELVEVIRNLAMRVQFCPTVTAEQKLDLGLSIHDRDPSPIDPPVTMPLVSVVALRRGSHVLRLADETTPSSRAKPEGVQGARVYVYIGDTPPVDLTDWKLYDQMTRTQFEVQYAPEDVGKQAHIAACWYNPRGQAGPKSAIVTERIAA